MTSKAGNTSMIPGVKKKVNDMATIFKTQATPQGELDLSNKSKEIRTFIEIYRFI